jgi:hypothetical protein
MGFVDNPGIYLNIVEILYIFYIYKQTNKLYIYIYIYI